jgi:hypothetical protein
MRSRTILAILCVAVVNAAGCGDTSHDSVNPKLMLNAAFARPISTAQAEIDLSLRVNGVEQLSGPLKVRLSGPYVSGGGKAIPRFDWRLSASALGFPVGGHLVSTGTNVYVTIYGATYEVGTPSVSAANQRLAQAPKVYPRSWIGDPGIVGEGHEGGEDCERIEAKVRSGALARDLAAIVANLGLSEPPSVLGRAAACVGFDDRTLHELRLTGVLAIPEADQLRLGGATSIAFDLDVVLSDVGEPQEISAPGGGGFRPIRDLALTLNDLGVPIPLG